MISDNNIGILYVDDESKALKYFKEILEGIAPVYIAENAEQGLSLFESHQNQIGIVLSDKNMPKMTGLEFLAKVRRINDQPLRMLVTAFKDLNQAVDALNDGLLHSYLTKPWEPPDMISKMRTSLDLYWIKQEKARLLRDRASSFQEMMAAEKVNSLESLSIGLDHHISKALKVVRSYFDMIPSQLEQELDGAMPKDQFFWSEYFTNVGHQIERVESICDGLSECLYSNASKGQLSSLNVTPGINIASLIGEVGNAETSGNSSISFEIRGEQNIDIHGDQAKLLRLFSTLFRESIQNIGSGNDGKIDVIIESETVSNGEPGVAIYFNDNGTPIDSNARKRLFDPFYLRSNRPTDIGVDLLSCFVIAYQHGGVIQADTSVSKNSIQLALPIIPRPPRQVDQSRGLINDLS